MASTWAPPQISPGGSVCALSTGGRIRSGTSLGRIPNAPQFEGVATSATWQKSGVTRLVANSATWRQVSANRLLRSQPWGDTWRPLGVDTWQRADANGLRSFWLGGCGEEPPPADRGALTVVCSKNKPRKRGPGTGGFYKPNRRPLAPRPRPPRKEKPEPEPEPDPEAALDLTKFQWMSREEVASKEPAPERDPTPEEMFTAMDANGVDAVDDATFLRVMEASPGRDVFWENADEAAKPRYDGPWSLRRARELKKKEQAVRRKGGKSTKVPGPGLPPPRTGRTKPREEQLQERFRLAGAVEMGAKTDRGVGKAPSGGGDERRNVTGGSVGEWRETEEGESGSRSDSEWGISDETFAEIQREFASDLEELQGSETDESDGEEGVSDADVAAIESEDDVDLTGFAESVLRGQERREKRKAGAEEKRKTELPADMRRILEWPVPPPADPAAWEFADENGYLTQDPDEHDNPEYDAQVGFSLEWFHEKLGYNNVFRSAFPEEKLSLAREVLARHLKEIRKMEPGLADFVAQNCNGFLDHEMLTKPPKGSPAEAEPDLCARMELRLRMLTKFEFLWAYFEAIGVDQERTKLGVMFQPITMTVPLMHRAITYLRDGLGFSPKEIHAVIVDSPHILRWQPDAFRKRREFFAFVGWDEKELIQKDPAAYSKEVDGQLRPMYKLLEKSGVKDVKGLWKEAPVVFGKNTLRSLEKKLDMLRQEGFGPDDVNALVINEPEALSLNVDGVLPPLIKILEKWGFTERQRVAVVAGWPEVLEQRRIFFNDRLKFIIEERGRTPADVAAWPQVLWYDVIERLGPCFSLAEKYGYLDKDLQFILQPPTEVFSSQRHLHPWLGDPKEIIDDILKNGFSWN